MQKTVIILAVITIIIFTILYFIKPKDESVIKPQPTPLIEESPATKQGSFNASFNITTNGTQRIFTDPRYHNQSNDVYVNKSDPHLIHVEKVDTTWDDFFETLPFSLSKDCLTTGTGQTFCTNENRELKFFINGIEDPNALDAEIMPNDNLEVVYK